MGVIDHLILIVSNAAMFSDKRIFGGTEESTDNESVIEESRMFLENSFPLADAILELEKLYGQFNPNSEGKNYNVSGALEYFLKEIQHYCECKHYQVRNVCLIRAPFDSVVQKSSNHSEEEKAAERNRLVSDIAIRAVRFAAGMDNQTEPLPQIYIDTNGAIRDIMTTIIATVRLMRAKGIEPAGILSTEFDFKDDTSQRPFSITMNNNMYRVFDLVSGLDEFISYGRADKLVKYYKDDVFFKKLKEMGNTFLLCHPSMMLESVSNVISVLYEAKKKTTDDLRNYIVEEVMRDLEKLSENVGSSLEDYLIPLIHWCIRKNLVQQALTLYAEKMPELIVKKRILYFDTDIKGKETIVEDIRNLKKLKRNRSYTTEYIFIQKYLILKDGYCKKINFNPFGQGWSQPKRKEDYDSLLKAGMKSCNRTLKSDWPQDRGTIASILCRYYPLKRERDKMNHANSDIASNNNRAEVRNHPTTGEEYVKYITKEMERGLCEIESLFRAEDRRITTV